MAIVLGSLSINNIDFIEVDGDPSLGAGTESEIGNIAVVNQAGFPFFQKFDVGDTDWRPIAVRSFAHYSNTQVNQNLNASTNTDFVTEVEILGTELNLDDDFTKVGEQIRCNFDGFIKCSVNLHLWSTSSRVGVQCRFKKNSVLVGPVSSCAYIRDASGHQESSLHIFSVVPVVNGDLININSRREAANGSVFLDSVGTSDILIERF